MSIWASSDLARAYADVRSDLSPGIRSVWGEAFRSAVPARPPCRLLDLGCGTGRFTALLAQALGAPTVGIDGSTAMLRERVAVSGVAPIFAAADATALPFRAASFDVALLSMVYHLLYTGGVAAVGVGELRRVLQPHGWVLLRTPSLEIMDRISWLPFFPGARALDERRLPPRRDIVATFEQAGFTAHGHRLIEQEFAPSPMDALEAVRRRPFSTLRLLPDAAFEEGVKRYETHCRTLPPTPLIEALDFFVFQRRESRATRGSDSPAEGASRGRTRGA